jgi:hypothetical protein
MIFGEELWIFGELCQIGMGLIFTIGIFLLPLPFYAYILFRFVLPHGFHEEFLMRNKKKENVKRKKNDSKKVSPVLVVRMP